MAIFHRKPIIPLLFEDHPVIQLIASEFSLQDSNNWITLPAHYASPILAGVTPHPSGPDGVYVQGVAMVLDELRQSDDFTLASKGAAEAFDRLLQEVKKLQSAMCIGLVNGDLCMRFHPV